MEEGEEQTETKGNDVGSGWNLFSKRRETPSCLWGTDIHLNLVVKFDGSLAPKSFIIVINNFYQPRRI